MLLLVVRGSILFNNFIFKLSRLDRRLFDITWTLFNFMIDDFFERPLLFVD